MLCFRFSLLLAIAIYGLAAEAQPLAYQQCADIQLEKFRRDELNASKELLHSLVELTRLIHGEPFEVGRVNLIGGSDRISGMSSLPPSFLLGG